MGNLLMMGVGGVYSYTVASTTAPQTYAANYFSAGAFLGFFNVASAGTAGVGMVRYIPYPLEVKQALFNVRYSSITNTLTSSISLSLWAGIYSVNGGSFSQLLTGSSSFTFRNTTTPVTINSILAVPFNTTAILPPGNYVIAQQRSHAGYVSISMWGGYGGYNINNAWWARNFTSTWTTVQTSSFTGNNALTNETAVTNIILSA